MTVALPFLLSDWERSLLPRAIYRLWTNLQHRQLIRPFDALSKGRKIPNPTTTTISVTIVTTTFLLLQSPPSPSFRQRRCVTPFPFFNSPLHFSLFLFPFHFYFFPPIPPPIFNSISTLSISLPFGSLVDPTLPSFPPCLYPSFSSIVASFKNSILELFVDCN